MANLTLTEEQYVALASLAESSTNDLDRRREIVRFLREIEKANNITRFFLWVQWQEAATPLPVGTKFPNPWPPSLRLDLLRFDRAWAKSEVLAEVNKRAPSPINILVTKDPGANVGWLPIDKFFV